MPSPSPLAARLADVGGGPDMHALLAELRATEPVAWCEARRCWVVTSHELVRAALEDPRLSNRRTAGLVRAQLPQEHWTRAADFERIVSGMMLMHDGASHQRLRSHGNRGLTPGVLERVRPAVVRIADELLDGCGARRQFDLVSDFALAFPARVIAALFHLPEEGRDRFQVPSEALARFFGGTLRDPLADATAANSAGLELEAFFRELLARRKREPAQDLMGLFLAGQSEHGLTDDEICAQCIVLLAGGHVTTRSQIANAIHALLSTTGAWRELCLQPELAPSAVEESLRFDSSVPFVFRLAAEDLSLGGRAIEEGQMLLLGLSAANRDPAVFPDPDRFDIHRPPSRRHLAFGQGPHYCMGAGLARLELEVALTAIARRMPGLRLDPERPPKRWCESLVFRGFESLALRC